MNIVKIISKSIRYYKKEHLLVLIGVIISTAVLSGALIIGDSVKYSLKEIVNKRLGNTQQIIQTQGRFFPNNLAEKLENETDLSIAPILILKGMASSSKNDLRLSDVQICGINNQFNEISKAGFINLRDEEVIINKKTAEDLNISVDDEILIRIEKVGFVSLNAPFVPDEDNTVSVRMKVKAIIDADNFGNFNLKTDQITPYNVFISQHILSSFFFDSDYANTLLIPENDHSINEINTFLKSVWGIEDINLHFRKIKHINKTELISDRIFIEDKILDLLNNSGFKPTPVFTYLVNFIRTNEKETPYSFVAAIQDTSNYELEDNEIIINQWMADDLDAETGDSIDLHYFIVGNLRKLIEVQERFIIKDITAIKGFAADSLLMPAFEGLVDVNHCSDWEAGIPMEYSRIRDKDEAYWNKYQGTPKAFISYEKAVEIWGSDMGNLTSLRFNSDVSIIKIKDKLLRELQPTELGLNVYDIRNESMWSASNAVDFAQLFLGLSFFLILAAFILTGLLFSMLLSSRIKEQGILLSLGLSEKKIKNIFLIEGMAIAIIGSFIGVFFGILLNKIVLYFLNSIWYDVIRTSAIALHVKPMTLISAFIINSLIAGFVIWLTVRRRMKQNINELNKVIVESDQTKLMRTNRFALIIFIIGTIAFFTLLIWSFLKDMYQNSDIFFMNGFILLAVLISATYFWLNRRSTDIKQVLNTKKLALRNLSFSKKRNLSTIGILSIGIFIVISTGINRVDFHRNADDPKSGSGGFKYFAETNIPINADMNSKQGLSKLGLEHLQDSISFVQFQAISGDDASCLNLNRIIRPRIIGFNPMVFIDRKAFSFAKEIEKDSISPWNLLNKKLDDNCIPAIADQTIIKWGLGKSVGDSVSYINEKGDTIHLVLMAGLSNSVFQGNMIISQENFKQNFPSISGSKLLLVDAKQNDSDELKIELLRAFRNYGIKIEKTADRLEMFNSVTNTYLDIFLALGGIALILGTFGVAIVLIRNIKEQEHLMAVMQAFGIKKKQLYKIIRIEHITVLLIGIIIGILAAFTASFPAILSDNLEIPFGLLFSIIGIFLINGLIWIFISSKLSLKGAFIYNLRNE